MKKFFTIFVSLLLVMGAVNLASAAYVDIRPNQPDPYSVSPGDPFSVEIWLTGDGGSSSEVLTNYAFDICFDSTELEYVSATETWAPGYMDIAPLYYNYDEERLDKVPGYTAPAVENVDGFTFGSLTLTYPVYMGSIDFTVLTPLFDGVDDVRVGYHSIGQGVTVDAVITFPDSIGPDLAQVPIPAAAWLLGSGLLGLIGVRRYRKD